MKHLLLDYGGTNFRWIVVDDLAPPLVFKNIEKKPSKDMNLKEFLLSFRNKNLNSIRISFAGQVKNAVICSAPNIVQESFNIKKFIQKNFTKTKLFIDNDLNCAALAESAVYKSDNLGVYYVGTGFGASAISGGTLIKGDNNLANEIGHLPFKKSTFECICGKNDCVELFCSGKALEKRCYQLDTKLSYHNLSELKNSPNQAVKKIYDDFIEGLFFAVKVSVTLFDFETVVLGGSVIKNNTFLKKLIAQELQSISFANQRDIKVNISTLSEGSLEGTRFLK